LELTLSQVYMDTITRVIGTQLAAKLLNAKPPP
jgi:hypothetical protein